MVASPETLTVSLTVAFTVAFSFPIFDVGGPVAVTLKDIAKELGMTAGRVSQLMKEVIQGENVVPFRKSGAGASQGDRERD